MVYRFSFVGGKNRWKTLVRANWLSPCALEGEQMEEAVRRSFTGKEENRP